MSDGARDGEVPDNPGVVAPPPLIYASALAAGLLLNRRRPVPFLPRNLARALGASMIAGGLLVGTLGLRALKRAGTNVDPYKPVTAVVTAGPYRYTRNPLYIGLTLMYAGVTVRANALPAALLLPAVLHVMHHGVIAREERYLEGKFGEAYREYKGRVPRWI